jgi:hypothetical protein
METLLASLGPATVSVEEFLLNSTAEMNRSSLPALCVGQDCPIDHSLVCVGDPEFCNLTKAQYEELLRDYISPSPAEWILIFSHIVVFLMGLVSCSMLRETICTGNLILLALYEITF